MKRFWLKILPLAFAFEVLAILVDGPITKKMLSYRLSEVELGLFLFIGTTIIAWVITRKLYGEQLKNGLAFGIATVAVYLLISVSAEMAGVIKINYDLYYFINHAAKIFGGFLGGFISLQLSNSQAPKDLTSSEI